MDWLTFYKECLYLQCESLLPFLGQSLYTDGFTMEDIEELVDLTGVQ